MPDRQPPPHGNPPGNETGGPHTPGSNIGEIVRKITGESACPGNRALTAFIEGSPDPVFLFDESCEMIGRNHRAVDLWEGVDNYIPPQLLQKIHEVGKGDSEQRTYQREHLIPIRTAEGQRYFAPSVFHLLDTSADSEGIPCGRIVACVLKDATVWERSERIRKNLLSSISHELNTPLTSARVALYLLAEQRIGELNPKQLHLVENAKQDLDREIHAIRNVLALIRAEGIARSEIETQPLNLHEMVEEAMSAFEPQLKSLVLPVRRDYVSTGPWFELDRETAQLVIHQLFASILKHSGTSEELCVGTSTDNGNCSLELVIRNGDPKNFPPEDLFDIPMEDQRMRELGCADLGLRVAHEILAPFGGTLSIKRSGTSATLRLRLPRLDR